LEDGSCGGKKKRLTNGGGGKVDKVKPKRGKLTRAPNEGALIPGAERKEENQRLTRREGERKQRGRLGVGALWRNRLEGRSFRTRMGLQNLTKGL